MVAAITTENPALTEDSTAAPDTPASSEVSAPSAGNGAARRTSASSGRMSRVKEIHPTAVVRKEECKDLHEGARSVPVAPPSRQATVLVARPVNEVSASARGLRSSAGPGPGPGLPGERKGVSGTLRTAQGRSAPAPAGPGRSPGRSPSKRGPNRSNSPSTGAPGRTSPATRRKEQELLEQKAMLELQISDATRSQMLLQRMLDEERSRGAADRAKLAALGARIEQLERTRQSGPRLLEENQTLYTELEAQSQQIEILRQQVQLLRDGGREAFEVEEPSLREENLRLRRDLELSRAMLSRYTEELASIMPGMQKVLQKFDHEPHRSLTAEDGFEREEPAEPASSSTMLRPMPEDEVPTALQQVPPSRLPVAPVAQEAPASFLAARKHEAARKASNSPQRKSKEDRAGQPRAGSPVTGKAVTLGRAVTPTLAGRLCNRLWDEAAARRAPKGPAESEPRRALRMPGAAPPRRRSTSPQGALTQNSEGKPRWQF